MAKEIYLVYEIDRHESIDSMVVKVFHTSKKITETFYRRNHKDYKSESLRNPEDYKLVFAKIDRAADFSITSNALRNIIKIKQSY